MPEKYVLKINKMPEFYTVFAEKLSKYPNFYDICPPPKKKLTKLHDFARKCPNFT